MHLPARRDKGKNGMMRGRGKSKTQITELQGKQKNVEL